MNSLNIRSSLAFAGQAFPSVPAMAVSAACCFFRFSLCSRFIFVVGLLMVFTVFLLCFSLGLGP